MDRSNICQLVYIDTEKDEIGQDCEIEKITEVFCNVSSVSGKEWHDAGQNNIQAQYKITVFAPEYNGEKIVILDGIKYSVYRTYLDTKREVMELYLEEKVGV